MAFIRYSQPFNGHIAEVVSADKAKAIQEALDNPQEGLSDDQIEYLSNIQAIYHNTKNTPKKAPDTSHMTHMGIEQGKNMALPTNDR